ncbi:MAG: Sarcosine oxidase beta subunit [Rhodospirillales bacterium]|nr:Sarcosine oxidase beta subunit [Rhodospirillales bacterium]
MAPDRADAVIVGGGIAGLAIAWELRKRAARRIVVLERRFSGYGSSMRNIGRVRAMQLTPELARIAIAAQAKHAGLSRELGRNTLFWRAGYALVLYDPEEPEMMRGVQRMLRELGLKTELAAGAETVRRLPILEGGAPPAGALIRPDASVHHDAAMFAYRRACLAAGIEIREGVEVSEILTAGGRAAGVVAAGQEISAPLIVNAAGAWSGVLSAKAGVKIPNRPLRRQALVTEPSRPFMRTMVSFYRPVEGWFHQTLRGEVVMGVVPADEPVGTDLSASAESLGRTARGILAKAPRLGSLRVVRQWAGLYDVTPDRKPMVGPTSALPGFVQLNGCNGRGFALFPILAELLARWIDEGRRPDLLAPFDAERFAGQEQASVTIGDYYAGYRKALDSSGATMER